MADLRCGAEPAVGAAAVLNAERTSAAANITPYPDALWWALTTVTTVGYGDHFPTTPDGGLVAAVLMVVGIGVVGTVTAAIASSLIRNRAESSGQVS